MKHLSCAVLLFLLAGHAYGQEATYVGSAACADCHEEQYESFKTRSKKARSWKSIAIMASDLKEHEKQSCFECHTTGYGRPGGFVSKEKTPHMADVGCEACHGPGSTHVDSGDPEDVLAAPSLETCETCHGAKRVGPTNFKALRYSGAH